MSPPTPKPFRPGSLQRFPTVRRLTLFEQGGLIGGLCCVLVGFWLAYQVTPDSQGFGTHRQFGLPPCQFQEVFRLPCPSCGGTTSVAHFVRGSWISSVQSNPAAFCLSLTGLIYIPWAITSLTQRRFLIVQSPLTAYLCVTFSLCLIALVQWLCRILPQFLY